MGTEHIQLAFDAGSVFTPGAPINERELFAGRITQMNQIMGAVSQRGYHAVLYGERGVGKTSISNVLQDFLTDAVGPEGRVFFTRVNCDSKDTFTSLWVKALKDITVSNTKPGLGFNSDEQTDTTSILTSLNSQITPDDVRRLLSGPVFKGVVLVIIFDEFDRIQDKQVTALMADCIKALSDYSVPTTILVIGVADSVDTLIHEHQSIERALVQIPMPRMSNSEIQQIIINGLARLTMEIDPDALDEITTLSQGIPYIAHLLGLHCSKACLARSQKTVTMEDLAAAIQMSLDQWQQSIKAAHYAAVSSKQPSTIHREVLLACALAKTDEMGFFAAANVRHPLSVIAGRKYEIPNFAKHLKEFTVETRGAILKNYGDDERRYRFTSPLMRPYIIMKGFAEGMLDKDKMTLINDPTANGSK